jgi:hypothetical protein
MGDMDAGAFFTTAVFLANLITLFRGGCVRVLCDVRHYTIGDGDLSCDVLVLFLIQYSGISGNQVADYFDADKLLVETSVSEYMSMANTQ